MANSAIHPARSRPSKHVSNVSCTVLGEGSSFTLKKYTFNFIKKIWNRTSTIEMQMGPANLRISAKSSLNIFVQYCQRLSNIKHYLYVCDQHQQYQQAGLGVSVTIQLSALLARLGGCLLLFSTITVPNTAFTGPRNFYLFYTTTHNVFRVQRFR